MALQFVLSAKQKKLLVVNGYLHSQCGESKDGTKIFWRCVGYVTARCHGRVHTTSTSKNGMFICLSVCHLDYSIIISLVFRHLFYSLLGKILKEFPHDSTCIPRPEDEEVKRAIGKIKKRARRSNEVTCGIVAVGVSTIAEDAAANAPNDHALSRMVQRERKKCHPQLPEPTKREDLVINGDFKLTLKKAPFVFFDSQGKERLIIFTTNDNIAVLRKCKIWSVDGTFETCPNIFAQLYSIHGFKRGKLLPLVYALTANRSTSTYKKILLELKDVEPQLNPKKILIDYEKGFISAAKSVFKEVELHGCFFHFCQYIWRKVGEFHLVNRCGNDLIFMTHVKMLMSLAFVPVDFVIEAYEEFSRCKFVKDNDDFEPLLEYFEDVWVGKVGRRCNV